MRDRMRPQEAGKVMTGLIAHEWIESAGGSERVVEQLIKAFPDTDLQVLWNDTPDRFANTRTYETWLARTPLRHHKALALPFLPFTWRTVKAHKQYDWILTSSHLFSHHIRLQGAPRDTPKYSYIHTPARYIWEPELDHRGANPLARLAGSFFKPLDRKRATESVKIAANSEFTRQRIQRAWGVDADVIYPPVDTARIIAGGDWRDHLAVGEVTQLDSLPESFLLGASRFVPYKRLDLVIEAGEAVGAPVVIAGKGPGQDMLRARADAAKVPVYFVIAPSDALLFALYQRSLAFIFPAIEDFGIMPVEAMAAGTPVIVSNRGGALETVREADGGAVTPDFSAKSWRQALTEAESKNREGLAERATRFSNARFRAAAKAWISKTAQS